MKSNYKWWVVALLWFVCFFNYADRQAIFSVFPKLQQEMGLDNVQLSFVGASFMYVYALIGPVAGMIGDRLNRKFLIISGLIFWSLVTVATAMSTKYWHLVTFRALEGFGEAFYFPASMSLISDYHGKRTRSRAMGTHQTSVYIGTIAGGFFAGLIGQKYGWRWSFVIFGGCGILLGLVLRSFLIEPERGAADRADAAGETVGHVKPRRMSVREFVTLILSTPTMLLLMAAFMCENFTAMVLFTWMPTLLYQKFNMSLALAGLTATLYVQGASMIGSPMGGWFADSLRRRMPGGRILVQGLGILLEAPFAALCALTGSMEWLIAGLALWGVVKGFYEANIFASAFDVIRPEARGTATGFMNMMGWLAGGGTAPVVVGYLSERIGLSRAMALASLSYVVASVLLVTAALVFAPRDTERMRATLAVEALPAETV